MKIKIYSREGCQDCERLKKILQKAEISFEEVKLDDDLSDMIVKYGIYSTPALEIGGMMFAFKRES